MAQSDRLSIIKSRQVATPANPPAGQNLLYPKADNQWYTKDSSGNEVSLTALQALTLAQLNIAVSDANVANDSQVVHLTGDETIAGQKSFSTTPLVPPNSFTLDVRCATTGNITLSGTQTIDGVSVVAGNYVLVKNQNTTSTNGVYQVAAGAWFRVFNFDVNALLAASGPIKVRDGTINGGTAWICTFPTAGVLSTDPVNFVQVGDVGSASDQTISGIKTFTVEPVVPANSFQRVVAAATTANITLSGTQTIDGVAVTAGQLVLVKNQSTQANNGVYTVAAGAWSRTPGWNTVAKIAGSGLVAVAAGTVNGGTDWQTTFKSTDTLGTTAMVWYSNLMDGFQQTVTNKLLSSGITLGTSLHDIAGAWQSWTPALTAGGVACNNQTSTGRYIQIGKTVHFEIQTAFTAAPTTTGVFAWSQPVASRQTTGAWVGGGRLPGNLSRHCLLASATTFGLYTEAGVQVTNATVALVNGNVIFINGTYETTA